MKKINRRIEIIRAHDIKFSSMGLKSGAMIQELLSKHYQDVSLSTVKDLQDLEALVGRDPDLVILGLKRIRDGSELIWISEFLEANGINYTGSMKSAMKLDLNKADAKALMQLNDISTADFFTASPGQFQDEHELPLKFPLFIKPHDQGGGMGIAADSVVHNFSDFRKKVDSLHQSYGTFSLVEQYLDGREFSVALLGSGYDEDLLAMPIELITTPNERGDRILSQAVKSEDNERATFINDDEVRHQIAELARNIYRTLGGRDYGRIDLRMDSEGKAHFIEANLTPGIASNDFVSYFNRACELNQNMGYEEMILEITDIALQRSAFEASEPIDLQPVPVPL